jgi:hypothetical protein
VEQLESEQESALEEIQAVLAEKKSIVDEHLTKLKKQVETTVDRVVFKVL